jgi:hypothetical protein
VQNRGGAYASSGAVDPLFGEAEAGGRRRGSLRSWFGCAGAAGIGLGAERSRAAGGRTSRSDRLAPSHSACQGHRIVATEPSRAGPGPSGSSAVRRSGRCRRCHHFRSAWLSGCAVWVPRVALQPPLVDASRELVRPDADRRRAVSLVAGRVVWAGRAVGSHPNWGASRVLVLVDWLEVVLVEVAGDRRAEPDALEVGGPEVDAGPYARVDALL